MKKNLVILLILSFLSTPCLACPNNQPNCYDGYGVVQVEQPYEPYEYYPQPQPLPKERTVVVKRRYDGINTAANVITAIATMITAITVLSR